MKYSMHRYEVRVVTQDGRVWTREVNATNANDAKGTARLNWVLRDGSRLVKVSAKRIGLYGINLSGWKEA